MRFGVKIHISNYLWNCSRKQRAFSFVNTKLTISTHLCRLASIKRNSPYASQVEPSSYLLERIMVGSHFFAKLFKIFYIRTLLTVGPLNACCASRKDITFHNTNSTYFPFLDTSFVLELDTITVRYDSPTNPPNLFLA